MHHNGGDKSIPTLFVEHDYYAKLILFARRGIPSILIFAWGGGGGACPRLDLGISKGGTRLGGIPCLFRMRIIMHDTADDVIDTLWWCSCGHVVMVKVIHNFGYYSTLCCIWNGAVQQQHQIGCLRLDIGSAAFISGIAFKIPCIHLNHVIQLGPLSTFQCWSLNFAHSEHFLVAI